MAGSQDLESDTFAWRNLNLISILLSLKTICMKSLVLTSEYDFVFNYKL